MRSIPDVASRILSPRLIRLLAAVSLSVFLVSLTACRRGTEGKDLAATGLKTANVMASYYDSLAQDVADTWEMEAFTGTLRELPSDSAVGEQLQETINALNRRKLLALRLAATYQALEDLASYDASAEVGTAAANLGDAMQGIPGLPGGLSNPSGLFSAAATQLVSWKRTRDARKGAETLVGTLESLNTLFQKELPACQSISQERQNKVVIIARYLIQHKMVEAWPLLNKVPRSLGLKWSRDMSPPEDEKTTQALIALAQVRLTRMGMLSSAAGSEISQSLQLLLASHRQFLAKQPVDLATVQAGLQKSSSYLEEIEKLREEPE